MGVEGKDRSKVLEAGAQALSSQLGRAVQRLRKAQSMSLSDLSEQSGVAKSIISQIEHNETNPTLATIWRLSQALDVSIERVLAGRNTLAIMPTGAGKSLCYQLPALIGNGLTVVVSPLFGWRQDAFIASFQKAGERWVSRSPLEQALLGLAAPWLFPSEREYLLQNTFQLSYGAFDWRLNDLTGGIPN